jgi:predicted ester cyclase
MDRTIHLKSQTSSREEQQFQHFDTALPLTILDEGATMGKPNKLADSRMNTSILWLLVLLALSITACAHGESVARTAQEQRNIELFDIADFDLFSKQDWPRFRVSHTDDVHVVMPDGREVHGMKSHMSDMVDLFKSFPDMTIEEHPIKVAEGDWTAVVGTISGTFTNPMILSDGTTVPPTGKKARMRMATFARWKNDQIAEEILFWDRAEWMRQLGVAK